ncbi:MAG: FtsX-like permease family protein [Saprospiraceae bacterium]|nr:FtsX-like permease family protein [Saprospiraceae bacterium]
MNAFDESLTINPKVLAVTQSYQAPGLGAVARNVWNDHVPQSENFFPRILAVDYDYSETFGLEIIAGRDFDVSFGTDHLSSFLINEQAVNALGWESPEAAIGGQMVLEGKEGQVVGVMKDFNFNSLRNEITPLVMEVRPGAFAWFSVKIANSEIPQTLKFLEEKWKEFFPEKVFEYQFLDESINDAYTAETRLSSIIGYFSIIAILISCIGLFGLSAFVTRQRFKEIGIRKILGASVPQILRLLSKEFILLIGISMLIALPVTWYLLKDWLTGFAYRIDFPWWVPIFTGFVVMLLAFLTVSAQSLKTALSNPIEAIKEE